MGLGFTHTSPRVLLRGPAAPFLGGEGAEARPGISIYCPFKDVDPSSEPVERLALLTPVPQGRSKPSGPLPLSLAFPRAMFAYELLSSGL